MIKIHTRVFFCLFFLSIQRSAVASFKIQLLETLTRLIQSNCQCAPYNCCSKWGYCGRTDAYCGDGCQSGPCNHLRKKPSDPLILFTLPLFECIFPNLDDQLRHRRYQSLIESISGSKWKPSNSVELAIFLAHIAYATQYLTTIETPCSTEKDCHQYQQSWCEIDVPSTRYYYGRGMLLLSYPCNYYLAGQALGLDLLNDPDIVSQSDKLAALTAIWLFTHSGMNESAQRDDFYGSIKQWNRTSNIIEHMNIYRKVRQCFHLPEINII